jgi:hypothetical protein
VAIWLWTASRVATIKGGGRIDGDVARNNTHAPTAGAPFGVFVVGERAGGDGEKGAAGKVGLLDPALENVGFSGPSGCVDHDIAAGIKGADGISLPAVRQDKFLKSGEGVGQHNAGRCSARAGGQIQDALRGFAAGLKRAVREHFPLDWLRLVTWRTAGNL